MRARGQDVRKTGRRTFLLSIGLVVCLSPCLVASGQVPDRESNQPLPPPRAVACPSSWKEVPLTGRETLPIDLATALRLCNASNPTIALARARVQQALAR